MAKQEQGPTIHFRLTQVNYDALTKRAAEAHRKIAEQVRVDVEIANAGHNTLSELARAVRDSDAVIDSPPAVKRHSNTNEHRDRKSVV